jgi:hypothetical protein
MISARRALAATWLALLGTTTLIALALIREVSLHQIDVLLGAQIIGLKVNWILELAGIALIVLFSVRLKTRPLSHLMRL